jgi:hypothetical protein
MDKEEIKEEMIRIRNNLSKIFNESKEEWGDNWWNSDLMHSMGYLDGAINKIGTIKPKGVKVGE